MNEDNITEIKLVVESTDDPLCNCVSIVDEADMEELGEKLITTFTIRLIDTPSGQYGMFAAAYDALKMLDYAADGRQMEELLMLMLTAAFNEGVKCKAEQLRQQLKL